MDKVTQELIDLLQAREERGIKKYGQSVSNTDLTTDQWLQHALEESLDFAVYLSRLKQQLKKVTSVAVITPMHGNKEWVCDACNRTIDEYDVKQKKENKETSRYKFYMEKNCHPHNIDFYG